MASVALSYCGEQVRRYDNDRFLCTLFAPPAEREALWSIYAFNLELARIRESVTQPLLGHMRLRWWMDTLDAICDRRPPDHPVALALSETIQRFRVDRSHLDRIIAGRATDLEDSAPPTIGALIEYADATSAAVSAAALEILAATGDQTREAAREVAIAWALVGLVRAVPFHARSRRIYLPADLNRRAGLDAFELFDRGATAGLREVVAHVLKEAAEYLQRARDRRDQEIARALPILLPATLADLYLVRLRRAGYDPFDPALQAPSPLRMLRVALNRWRGRY
jgi:NADH dehydrogenase [ubiquinone] 1 alpha subcomplex assembly factor 6